MSLLTSASRMKRALELAARPVDIVGSADPLSLSWLLGHFPEKSDNILVVTPDSQSARQVEMNLATLFDKECVVSEGFDESPYSGLTTSKRSVFERMKFLWQAHSSSGGKIFVATVESLIQRSIAPGEFKDRVIHLKVGEEILMESLTSYLSDAGYESAPLVEDTGTFSRRGSIIDIFSPVFDHPIRVEFFGDEIESVRLFHANTQRTVTEMKEVFVCPCREVLLTENAMETAVPRISKFLNDFKVDADSKDSLLSPLVQRIPPTSIDFWVGSFSSEPYTLLDHFSKSPFVFWLDPLEIQNVFDQFEQENREKFQGQISQGQAVPSPESTWVPLTVLKKRCLEFSATLKPIQIMSEAAENVFEMPLAPITHIVTDVNAAKESRADFFKVAADHLFREKENGLACFLFSGTNTQAERTKYLFESHGYTAEIVPTEKIPWPSLIENQKAQKKHFHIFPATISSAGRLKDDSLVFIRDEDIFGQKAHRDWRSKKRSVQNDVAAINFGEVSQGDTIVHVLHGIGVYEGLKKLPLHGVENEYLSLRYRDNDRLYLPIYRINQIQKYSGSDGAVTLDKLGGTSWQKAKVKVKNALKDIADDLLRLYATRAAKPGFSFSPPDDDFREFEATFPYDETPDQAKAINDVLEDMQKERAMDRLVCGDVGFGKTEVAIRAAYKAVQDKKQVAILVPTTVLAFQHYRTFSQRFKNAAVNIALLSRFTPTGQAKEAVAKIGAGKIDIVIGTHRLLSKDVVFKDLGLLVVDEEQRFGVTQKEKIKKFKAEVDVLTLSATPIPRTLNMSLMGVRDLSLITTPPEERLSIRTFISRFEESTIRKAILNEIKRGGQVYFIHNKVQSINSMAEELRRIVPEAKIRIGHGQMPDEELESTMIAFFNHEFDVLLCTTIIENGLDISSANTIIIDRADTFGLSQLYQLRGRVGRSKNRSYAYLLIPPQGVVDKVAQERLRVLQENSELGSGIRVAHHDLELRGSGNILGEDQSGHIATVGYELYMELLNQALAEAKGEPLTEEIEPEINLPFQALIPDTYIEDIRIRLSYYRKLGSVRDESDLIQIEKDLIDRFGPIPDAVGSLFGLMLIRSHCKELAIKDISQGPVNLALSFSPNTKAKPESIIRLATSGDKYTVTPDHRLIIRMKAKTWTPILEELRHLKRILL